MGNLRGAIQDYAQNPEFSPMSRSLTLKREKRSILLMTWSLMEESQERRPRGAWILGLNFSCKDRCGRNDEEKMPP